MRDIAVTSSSRLVTVRLDAPIRERLDALTVSSDRTLAQLSRYALTAYFENNVPFLPPVVDETSNTRKHVSLRLPATLSANLDAVAQTNNTTASDVLRQALGWWLETADLAHLGVPGAAGAEVSE
jgi:predicted transcriptional regulator